MPAGSPTIQTKRLTAETRFDIRQALAREIRVFFLAAHSARPAFGERLRGTGEEGLGPRSDRCGGGLFEGVTPKQPFEGQETRIPLGCRSHVLE